MLKTEKSTEYTILIAEDEETNFLYLETLIKEHLKIDSTILRAKNGLEAIEVCKNNKGIDLLLLDLKMPLMNGFEAAKQIKEFLPELPIVAETAYSLKEEIERARLAGCDDFITKPISIDFFHYVISKYLKNNKEETVVG